MNEISDVYLDCLSIYLTELGRLDKCFTNFRIPPLFDDKISPNLLGNDREKRISKGDRILAIERVLTLSKAFIFLSV
jgi:hypothetical protein